MVKLKKFNKVAWLRVVEAFIGIIIISMVLLLVVSRDGIIKDNSDEIHQMQDNILEILSKNDSLRNGILMTNPGEENNYLVNSAIERLAPRSWNYSTKICDIDVACGMELPNKDIYVTERIFVSNLTHYNPKKLRLFVWMN